MGGLSEVLPMSYRSSQAEHTSLDCVPDTQRDFPRGLAASCGNMMSSLLSDMLGRRDLVCSEALSCCPEGYKVINTSILQHVLKENRAKITSVF